MLLSQRCCRGFRQTGKFVGSALKPKVALRAAAEPKTISTAVTMGLRCLALGPRSLSEAVLLLLLLWLLLA